MGGPLMAALSRGARVRVVSPDPGVAGRVGEIIEWRGLYFHVDLDGVGPRLFEPEDLERVRD
jgi:hypothetical protein